MYLSIYLYICEQTLKIKASFLKLYTHFEIKMNIMSKSNKMDSDSHLSFKMFEQSFRDFHQIVFYLPPIFKQKKGKIKSVILKSYWCHCKIIYWKSNKDVHNVVDRSNAYEACLFCFTSINLDIIYLSIHQQMKSQDKTKNSLS